MINLAECLPQESKPTRSDEIVFFDVDGTLLDQQYVRARALASIAKRYFAGFTIQRVTFLHDQILEDIVLLQSREPIDITQAGVLRFERLCAVLGQPASVTHAECIYRDYRFEHQRSLKGVAGANEVLVGLRALGVRLGIISNGYTTEQKEKLEALGLIDLFDVIVISESIGIWKPQAAIFLAAASLAGVEPERCVMVGDSVETDIVGGISAGFRCALVAPRTNQRLSRKVLHLNGFLPASSSIDKLVRLVRECSPRQRSAG